METQAILVAIMFVTILGMGIANLVMSLAAALNSQGDSQDRIMISWIVLLLLIHLNVFWITLTILDQEDWNFAEFLIVISGPILLFFSSQILLTSEVIDIGRFSRSHYDAVARRFFIVLCTFMAWALIIEIGFADSRIGNIVADLSALLLFGALASTKSKRAHGILTPVAWFAILSLFVLQGLEITV